MSSLAPLTDAEVQQLAAEWYHLLDVHAPIEQLYPLLTDDGLELYFPEGVSRGHAGFKEWYDRVTRIFFDEVHTLKKVATTLDGAQAKVDVIVDWEAHGWNPPAAKSIYWHFDAYQHWVVQRSISTGKPVILTYVVDELKALAGSASL